MGFRKVTNWKILRKKKPKETIKYRDVYEDQQLERSQIDPLQTMTSRTIFAIILSIVIFFISYFLLSLFLFSTHSFHKNFKNDVNNTSTTMNRSTTNTTTVVHSDEENPFAGYSEIENATDVGAKWFDKLGDGKYKLKQKYNYWNDTNTYQAPELSTVIGTCYTNYRFGNFPKDDVKSTDITSNANDSNNPFAGYADMKNATDIADKWFNPTPDGKYTFKDEYNFWNDANSYWAYELDDVIAKKYQQYEGGDVSTSTTQKSAEDTFLYYLSPARIWNLIGALLIALLSFALIYTIMRRNLDAQNLTNDTTDINQYQNDQHVALPEEVQRKFDWFPDAGAHSPVQVSSMISHVMIANKGIKTVQMAERHTENVLDENGDVDIYKGEIKRNDDDEPIMKTVPLFDKDFAESLYETSGMTEKSLRKYYDATKISYNPHGKDRTKQGGTFDTVADMINNTWILPLYEPQRPAGAYLVDTEPVNTMV